MLLLCRSLQQFLDLLVRSLRKIVIPKADSLEMLWRNTADDFINFAAKLITSSFSPQLGLMHSGWPQWHEPGMSDGAPAQSSEQYSPS